MLWGWLSGFLISHFYRLCTLVFLLFAMAIALGRILFFTAGSVYTFSGADSSISKLNGRIVEAFLVCFNAESLASSLVCPTSALTTNPKAYTNSSATSVMI